MDNHNPEYDLMVNGLGILKVSQYAQLIDVERFVYSSSGCGVYGLDSKMPFEEHDVSISLHTPYQVTKLIGELYANYFHIPLSRPYQEGIVLKSILRKSNIEITAVVKNTARATFFSMLICVYW